MSQTNSNVLVHELTVFVGSFPLEHTLNCGQVFCWQKHPLGGWEGWIGEHPVVVLPAPKGCLKILHTGDVTEHIVREYFCVCDALESQAVIWAEQDEFFAFAWQAVGAIRLVRQPAWECLASFICSAQKQVVQIQAINRVLRNLFGNEGLFPSPERLAMLSVEELRCAPLGFRARNLLSTSRYIAENTLWFENLRHLPTGALLEELQRLPGVGRKIAHCVALFGYQRMECFPVDVWVRRILEELYFPRLRKKLSENECYQFGPEYFGGYCGIAQQIMFHWLRNMPHLKRVELLKMAKKCRIARALEVLRKIRLSNKRS